MTCRVRLSIEFVVRGRNTDQRLTENKRNERALIVAQEKEEKISKWMDVWMMEIWFEEQEGEEKERKLR